MPSALSQFSTCVYTAAFSVSTERDREHRSHLSTEKTFDPRSLARSRTTVFFPICQFFSFLFRFCICQFFYFLFRFFLALALNDVVKNDFLIDKK